MKKIIVCILIMTSLVTVAQDKYQKADKLFENMAYLEASRVYEETFEKGDESKELLERIGDSYFFNSKMKEASYWYDQLFLSFAHSDIEAIYAFRYIHSLQGSKQMEKAELLIPYFSEADLLTDIQVEQLVKENKYTVDDILARAPEFEVYKVRVNSPYSDFAPMFYKDEIVFASARDTMDAQTREYHWNEQSFLNLFRAERVGLKKQRDKTKNSKEIKDTLAWEIKNARNALKLGEPLSFSKTINTKYHEAAVSFSPLYKTVYFTRNNYQDKGKLERDSAGTNHLKLYRSSIKKSEKSGDSLWTNIYELPFNSVNYSVGHPAVSPDGNTLYFVSDMPGGYGATDIYKVKINENGSFGQPENLGPNVNTSGREMFPYASESKFYFSSDGHMGLGALDVFEISINEDDTFNEPRNLGAPLNSPLDDFGFIIEEETMMGYFSSNRKGGKGDDDIYSFFRTDEAPLEPCIQTGKGIVINKLNGNPIPFATVILKETSGTILETVQGDASGKFIFETPLDCERSYFAIASKEKYGEDNKEFMTTNELDLEMELSLGLEPEIDLISNSNGVKKFEINNLYFDLDKHFIRPDAAAELEKIVTVMTEYTTIVIKIESHTDARGSDPYNEALSDRRAKSTRDYLISRGIAENRIESAIGYGESRLLNECRNGVKCSNEKHDINRRSEFIITKM